MELLGTEAESFAEDLQSALRKIHGDVELVEVRPFRGYLLDQSATEHVSGFVFGKSVRLNLVAELADL